MYCKLNKENTNLPRESLEQEEEVKLVEQVQFL